MPPNQAAVTGAFSFTGRYVAKRLLDQGVRIRTLTRNPGRSDPFGGRVPAAPLDFSDPEGLRRSIQGRVSSTTPTGCGSGAGGPPLSRRWRTPRCCLKRRPRPA